MRRNSDESIRALERRWQATGSDADRLAYFRAAARAGRLVARELRALHVAEHGRKQSPFDKFVSWEQIYERIQQRSARGESPDTIEDSCLRWAEDALEYNAPQEIKDFEARHGVKLTEGQRDAVNSLWESILRDACYEAFLVDLRWVVQKAIRLVNDASESEILEGGFERRGLPPPSRLTGVRRLAVRRYREDAGPDGDGVWFSLSRPFIRAFAEAGYCAGNYHPDAVVAHPEELRIRRFDGDDVIRVARWWGECVGDRLRMPSHGEEPTSHIEFPTADDIMRVVLEAGPLRRRRKAPR